MLDDWGRGGTPCVFVEKTHAMPTNGSKANFSSGYSQGAICAVVQALSYPLHHVLPTAWKKTQGLVGKDKEASRALATDLFPKCGPHLRFKKDHNRAEALLIARHGRTLRIQEANA
jgi:crossover junction endodeoxyribonuclease RuvC